LIVPINPSIVNRKINPIDHIGVYLIFESYKVVIHLKILIPVGITMIIISEVKCSYIYIYFYYKYIMCSNNKF